MKPPSKTIFHEVYKEPVSPTELFDEDFIAEIKLGLHEAAVDEIVKRFSMKIDDHLVHESIDGNITKERKKFQIKFDYEYSILHEEVFSKLETIYINEGWSGVKINLIDDQPSYIRIILWK